MTITVKTVLVTGANRGIGQALAAEALRRGARRVSGGTPQPLAHPDGRITPPTLDDLEWHGVPRDRFLALCEELGFDTVRERVHRWAA